MSAAASTAGYLFVSHRSDAALARMQRAMTDIATGPQRKAARLAAELEREGFSTAPDGAQRR